ncbi:uncharacterized protein [Cherax quadricarinatus]|uniref:uncharacterized protein n=1 Tax=Cherax quadricarinatus TaxID=27406 RepID=UPI00387E9A51
MVALSSPEPPPPYRSNPPHTYNYPIPDPTYAPYIPGPTYGPPTTYPTQPTYRPSPPPTYYPTTPGPTYRPPTHGPTYRPPTPGPTYRPPTHGPTYRPPTPRPTYRPSTPTPIYGVPTHEAPAHYNFTWQVKDDASGNDYGHQETRDGADTQGSYYVLLPDGRLERVTYTVNGDSGYVPQVTYEGHTTPQPYYTPTPVYG